MRLSGLSARARRLQALRAFGLYVKGMSAREIALLFEAQENVRYEGSDVYQLMRAGWELVAARCRHRWPLRMRAKHHGMSWLKGCREAPPPPPADPPPPKDLSMLERLLMRLEDVERFATEAGFHDCANGLRNMRAAVIYNEREKRARDEKARAEEQRR